MCASHCAVASAGGVSAQPLPATLLAGALFALPTRLLAAKPLYLRPRTDARGQGVQVQRVFVWSG
jgi:hypothetical protein